MAPSPTHRRQLRVAVPAGLARLSPHTGHGKAWRTALDGLARETELELTESRRRRRWWPGRAPDVWLADGYDEPLDVREPVVLMIHEAPWRDRTQAPLLDARFSELMVERLQAAVTRAHRFLVPSRSAARELYTFGVARDTVDVVPHGVDLAAFRPGLPGGAALVARTAGGAPAPYVLFVGTVHPRKNVAAVRGAVASLAEHGFRHRLLIVAGPAPDRADSEQLRLAAVAELPGASGRLVCVEHPTDEQLAALMAGADVLCLPSFSEGFGFPVLEAMACGTPVVVSQRGSLPELVGDAGVLVEPSAASVREGLERVLADPAAASRLGTAARARAEQFSWERTVRGWHRTLCRAATEHRD